MFQTHRGFDRMSCTRFLCSGVTLDTTFIAFFWVLTGEAPYPFNAAPRSPLLDASQTVGDPAPRPQIDFSHGPRMDPNVFHAGHSGR